MSNGKDKREDTIRIVFAVIIIIVFLYFYGKINQPTQTQAPAVAASQTQIVSSSGAQSPEVKRFVPSPSIPKEEKRVTLTSDNLEVKLSTKGAVVTSSRLRKKSGSNDFYDFSKNSKQGYEVGSTHFGNNLRLGGEPLYYRLENFTGESALFSTQFRDAEGHLLTFQKEYTIDDRQLKLKISLKNEEESSVKVPFFLVNNAMPIVKRENQKTAFDTVEMSYTAGGDNKNALGFSWSGLLGSSKNYEEISQKTEWIAIETRFYFQVLGMNNQSYPSVFWKDDAQEPIYAVNGYDLSGTLSSGEQKSYDLFYEFLPKSRQLLNFMYDEKKKDYYLIFRQFSFMKVISDMLYSLIEYIYKLTSNYGWTIILMTLFIKLIFFPLTQKSYKSMQKMQKISPKIEELKKKYKNNPAKMNTEMMALYKREDVNILMGCVPMMIPIPIFIALYTLFRSMYELDGIGFLWMKNLTLPDNIIVFDKSLPFVGDGIRLIPFLLVISQLIQNKFTLSAPVSSDNEAAKMQVIMVKYLFPAMFFLISWGLPSALTLYWLVQNLFSIGQNLYIKRGGDGGKKLAVAKKK